jgi:hypothetical protein
MYVWFTIYGPEPLRVVSRASGEPDAKSFTLCGRSN